MKKAFCRIASLVMVYCGIMGAINGDNGLLCVFYILLTMEILISCLGIAIWTFGVFCIVASDEVKAKHIETHKQIPLGGWMYLFIALHLSCLVTLAYSQMWAAIAQGFYVLLYLIVIGIASLLNEYAKEDKK